MVFQWDVVTLPVSMKSLTSSFTMVGSFYDCTLDVGQKGKEVFEIMSVFCKGLVLLVLKWKLQAPEHSFKIVNQISVEWVEKFYNLLVILLISSRTVHSLT